MREIIAVSNQKGGVGKSTTANALGAGLALRGFRVLYVDLDAQGNLSDMPDGFCDQVRKDLYEIIRITTNEKEEL